MHIYSTILLSYMHHVNGETNHPTFSQAYNPSFKLQERLY